MTKDCVNSEEVKSFVESNKEDGIRVFVAGGSRSGNDKIYGGAGNDTISAGAGNNTIYYSLGDGDDVILYGGENAHDTLVFDK